MRHILGISGSTNFTDHIIIVACDCDSGRRTKLRHLISPCSHHFESYHLNMDSVHQTKHIAWLRTTRLNLSSTCPRCAICIRVHDSIICFYAPSFVRSWLVKRINVCY